jgi:hypothetical protein
MSHSHSGCVLGIVTASQSSTNSAIKGDRTVPPQGSRLWHIQAQAGHMPLVCAGQIAETWDQVWLGT